MSNPDRNTTIAVMANDMSYIKEYVKSIDHKISNEYITKQAVEVVVSRLEAKLNLQARDIKVLLRGLWGTITVALLGIAYAILNVIGL